MGLLSPLGTLRPRAQQAAAGGRRLLGRAAPRAFGELSRRREAAALRGNRKAKALLAGSAQARARGVSHSLSAPPPISAPWTAQAQGPSSGWTWKGWSYVGKAEAKCSSSDLKEAKGPRSPFPFFSWPSLPRLPSGSLTT